MQLLFSDYSRIATPSASTLSRARRKVDLAMMHDRRKHWDANIAETSIQLGSLSVSIQYVCVFYCAQGPGPKVQCFKYQN